MTNSPNVLREKAFLNKGIRITIKDEREEPENSHEFYYKAASRSSSSISTRTSSALHDKPIYFEKVADALSIEVAIQYNDGYDEKVYSFANNINTVDGGTHLSGFRSAFTRTINAYAQSSGLAKNFKTYSDRRRRARRPGGSNLSQAAAAAV